MTKRARGLGQRLRRASGPTAVASNRPAPSTAKEPDHTGIPGASHRQLRFAGQIRLIQGEPIPGRQLPIRDHLIAAGQLDQFAHYPSSTGTRRSFPSRTTTASGDR